MIDSILALFDSCAPCLGESVRPVPIFFPQAAASRPGVPVSYFGPQPFKMSVGAGPISSGSYFRNFLASPRTPGSRER